MTNQNQQLSQLLKAFNFQKLFITRGWNPPARQPFILTIQEKEVTCTPIAEQGGWTVLEIAVENHELSRMAVGDESDITAPSERAWRELVDKAVTDQIHHHILIFINPTCTEFVWQFSTTISGKRLRRERRLNAGTPIAPLVALLRGMEIPFEMLDDEGEISVTAMNDRMAQIGLYAERVSKRFFDQLKNKREGFANFLSWVDAEKDRSWYITALLNRLMFIYFIQHKGLMKNDPLYLRHRLNECIEHGFNFYRNFFLPLCFFGFAKPWGERKSYGNHFDGIPYLNGGLFLPHQVELDHGITPEAVEADTLPAAITIPNEQFVTWFDFFDSYRWTLDENNLDLEGQINPDILGFIFEKYINQKQMGAYYTKEDITGYICRNTIIPRLFDMLAATGKKGMQAVNPLPIGPHPNILNDGQGISGGEGIERYIYPAVKTQQHLPTETDREFFARQQRYESIQQDFEDGKITAINDIITYNLDIERLALDFIASVQDAEVLRDFYFEGLRKITVLDPTCGSGAFLFAALKVLYPLYAACVKKMEEFHQREAGGKGIAVTWKNVGVFDFANETAQQLEFLDTPDDDRQAILDQFGAELVSIREHDNVEYFIYKRIIVDNLFGVDIMAEAVEICKLRLFLKLIAHAEPVSGKPNLGIEPLPDVDFNILCGNTLVGFATHEEARLAVLGKGQTSLQFDDTMDRIEEKARAVDALSTSFRHAQTARNIHAAPEQKVALEKALRGLEHELNGYLARQYGILSQESKAYVKWLESHQPFHWYVEFFGTMKRGGFGVIIGNPPYVEYSKIKAVYHVRGFDSVDSGNLYAVVTERSLAVLDGCKGRIGLIIPISSFSTDRGESFRTVVEHHADALWLSHFGVRPAKLFEGVDQRNTIFLVSTTKSDGLTSYTTRYIRWYSDERPFLLTLLHYGATSHPRYAKTPDIEASCIAEKLSGASLAQYYGTGDYAFYWHRIPQYFIKAINFIPYFYSNSEGQKRSDDYKVFPVDGEDTAYVIMALLNSNLAYWYWMSLSEGYHFGKKEVLSLPLVISDIQPVLRRQLIQLSKQLMNDYKVNIRRRIRSQRNDRVEYDEFSPKPSKPIIDKIDRVLAQHYGFTDEELDFIINYDIKYRMGREAEGEDE